MWQSILICIGYFHSTVNPALIASGRIEKCSNQTDQEPFDCETKVVFTLGLTYDQDEGDTLDTILTEVEDENGEIFRLSTPWWIIISKSDLFIEYPLSYKQTFHGKPIEYMTLIDTTRSQCVDDPESLKPSCSIYKPGSQGFCCRCGEVDMNEHRGLQGLPYQCAWMRVDTVHCLSYDYNPYLYSAFEFNQAQVKFDISVTTRSLDLGIGHILLTPETPSDIINKGKLYAKLITDLDSYTTTETWDDFYYFVPAYPSTRDRVKNWEDNAMFIEKEFVTLNGRECDKIGTDYHAFQDQQDKCMQVKGSCLNNQLEDYHDDGNYFAQYLEPNMVATKYNDHEISLKFRQDNEDIITTSLVELSVSTENVMLIINGMDGYYSITPQPTTSEPTPRPTTPQPTTSEPSALPTPRPTPQPTTKEPTPRPTTPQPTTGEPTPKPTSPPTD